MDQLARGAHELGIKLSAEQTEQFSIFLRELQSLNASFNLTAITNTEEIILKHFIDSLTVIAHIPVSATTLLDLGSGGGFPGLPIKIIKPDLEVILLEANGKKVAFHQHIISMLRLSKITSIYSRAEDLGHDEFFRGRFDVVTARAVARFPTLYEYALPFLKVGGILIAQKTSSEEELAQGEQALKELGGAIQHIVPVTISGLEHRHIVIIKKISETPEKYPRRTGVPTKRPL
jgi:16S rRNA (guanine527-N7)-methyltransferase